MVNANLIFLPRKLANWSYTNSTVFDRTSGTGQLHCSNTCETFCAAIAVKRSDSVALIGTV